MLSFLNTGILLPGINVFCLRLPFIISSSCQYLKMLIVLWSTRTMGLHEFILRISSSALISLNVMHHISRYKSLWSTLKLCTKKTITTWWMVIYIIMWCSVEYPILLLLKGTNQMLRCATYAASESFVVLKRRLIICYLPFFMRI